MSIRTIIAAGAVLLLAACGSGGSDETIVARDGDATVAQGPNGTTTVTTAEGTTRIRTGAELRDLPGGLPPYPNAQATGGVDVTGAAAGGEGRMVMFTTSDSPAQVIDFYAAAAGRAGMETEARMTAAPSTSLALRRGEQQVTVTAVGSDSGTQVQIAAGIG